MAILIGAGFPLIIILVMYLFGMYVRRNSGWVLLCLLWGVIGYLAFTVLNTYLFANMGLSKWAVNVIIAPLLQQIFVVLGVFFVINRENFDNLIDGAVYGFASGLGFALYENVEYALLFPDKNLEELGLQALTISLVYATAAGIIGVAVSQYYFRHRSNRLAILLSGLGAGVGYTVLFKLLVTNEIGGSMVPVAFGIGGFTLIGLYVTGLLRNILIQVGVQKKRADTLLEIVIPIGVELSTETDFEHLLETMLVEAKKFCQADAGTLYLVKDKQLEFAVLRNDTFDIALGGTSEQEIKFPPLELYYEKTGEPNHRNLATHVALTGETVNIKDAYDTDRFDFSAAKKFDQETGYTSVSFLTIPLKNTEGKVLGVLQLINSLSKTNKVIIPFDSNLQQLMESFSLLAAAALEGYVKEQGLRNEIQKLRIEIDAVKREKHVAEITETDYFKDLQKRARNLRGHEEQEDPKSDSGG
jgi:RsiW-degrading membrane proteinase PrsW (M82 family)/GAF domain-containing protein